MAARPPKIRYSIAGIGSFGKMVPWVMEQFGSTLEIWSKVPWGWVSVVFLAFLIGQLIADWCNKNSWLAEKWEDYHRIFKIDQFVNDHNVQFKGESCRQIFVRLRFQRDVKQARILVHVYGHLEKHKPRQRRTWEEEEARDWNRGEEKKIILLTLSDKVKSRWGNIADNRDAIVSGPGNSATRNVVTVEVIGARKRDRQSYSVYVQQAKNNGIYIGENMVGNLFEVEGA